MPLTAYSNALPLNLNHSDHLPISAVLQAHFTITATAEQSASQKRIWVKALKSSQMDVYQERVTAIVNPLLGRSYNSPEELNAVIRSVSQQLCSAAQESLPLSRASNKREKWHKDQTLAQQAACKKTDWDEWSANGHPTEGPLHDTKIKTRAEFRKQMKICAANEERKRIQHFDQQLKKNSSNCFKLPSSRRRRQGTSLRVDGKVVTDQHTTSAS